MDSETTLANEMPLEVNLQNGDAANVNEAETTRRVKSSTSLEYEKGLEENQDLGTSREFEKTSNENRTQGSSNDVEEARQNTAASIKRVMTAQDWTGPDDPENPWNWSIRKKMYNTIVTGLLGFTVTFASSVYTPGYPEVMEQFGVSSTAALLGLSLYTLGLGSGPIIAAPISETFGRSIVYRVSIPVFMLFILGAGFSQTFAQLLVLRFFAGVFGSPVLAVGAGTSVDLWQPHIRAISTSIFLMAPFAGPSLGPVVGGFTAMKKGWRWTQWDTLFVALTFYLLSTGMSETYKKTILQRRAKRLGIEPPKAELPGGLAMLKVLFTVTLIRPIHMLLTEPIVAFMSIYTAFTFAVLFAFFAAFPIVFQGVYDFNPGESGTTFLAVGLGVVISVITGILADRLVYKKKHQQVLKEGRTLVPPEHRLYTAMWGSIGLPIGLFWLAWTARRDIHWIVPVLAAVPFAWGNLCIFLSAALYLSDTYGPRNGASALAANGLLRYTLGAIFPLFTVQMYRRLGIGWATSIFGLVSLLLLPIPWVLFKWGPQIRAKSSYDTIKA